MADAKQRWIEALMQRIERIEQLDAEAWLALADQWDGAVRAMPAEALDVRVLAAHHRLVRRLQRALDEARQNLEEIDRLQRKAFHLRNTTARAVESTSERHRSAPHCRR